MKNLYINSCPCGKMRVITEQDLSFQSISTDIYNIVEDRWYRSKYSTEFYDVEDSFIGYTKEELIEFVTSIVKKLYEENGVTYEL